MSDNDHNRISLMDSDDDARDLAAQDARDIAADGATQNSSAASAAPAASTAREVLILIGLALFLAIGLDRPCAC